MNRRTLVGLYFVRNKLLEGIAAASVVYAIIKVGEFALTFEWVCNLVYVEHGFATTSDKFVVGVGTIAALVSAIGVLIIFISDNLKWARRCADKHGREK